MLKHPVCTEGWVARLVQLAFPGESNPNSPWERSQWDNTVVKNMNQIKEQKMDGDSHWIEYQT